MANITLLLNSLLLFLLLLEDRLVVPGALQVMGRMHPLLLHFPLVLLIIYALYNVFIVKSQKVAESTKRYADRLLLIGAFTAALTALMGLFLSKEEGYDVDALQWHKWSGVAVSLFALIWYYARNSFRKRKITRWLSSLIAITVLIIAGHAGAGITHGEDFLLAPLNSEDQQPMVALDEALVYEDVVHPILESKCMGCHNQQKAKGELILTTKELLLKGGKSGPLWDLGVPGPGLLLERVHLPLDAKKHMPPRGKPQLTETEILILQSWLQKGARFDLQLTSLPPEDTLYQLASVNFKTESDSYDFEAADPSLIRSLNTENRVVMEEALNSPAISVSFFNSNQYQSEQLNELSKIKDQIISLDLTRMPLQEKDLQTVGSFQNLRRLYLGFTPVKGSWLKSLNQLEKLQSLTLSGTAVTPQETNVLKSLPKLTHLYGWQMPGTTEEWERLKKEWPQLIVETGFSGDTIRLKLSPPVLQNEITILTEPMPLKLKHYINGAEIRYTLDGSAPDSIQSPVYKGDEIIDRNVLVRAKAYKAGWYSSDIMEASIYKRSFVPDSVIFLSSPEPGYPPDPKLLSDLIKGDVNFRNGNWLAWRGKPMELLFPFKKGARVSSITLGMLVDVGSYIMPPLEIEVWGGDAPSQLRKLGNLKPTQPDKLTPAYLRGFECKFESQEIKYLKIVARPVMKLPSWHPGKGDKGWVFVDEVLVN